MLLLSTTTLLKTKKSKYPAICIVVDCSVFSREVYKKLLRLRLTVAQFSVNQIFLFWRFLWKLFVCFAQRSLSDFLPASCNNVTSNWTKTIVEDYSPKQSNKASQIINLTL